MNQNEHGVSVDAWRRWQKISRKDDEVALPRNNSFAYQLHHFRDLRCITLL